nr:phosphoglyceromutase [Hymenolepis microstoma]
MYGMLEGCDKSKLVHLHGAEQIMSWTRKYDIAPPPLTQNSRVHPIFENKYELFAKSIIPDTECHRDVRKRVLPFWCDEIVPAIKEGNRVLIVAHESVLRALIKYFDETSDNNIGDVDFTPCTTLVYEFNEHMRPIRFYYLKKDEQDKQPCNTLDPCSTTMLISDWLNVVNDKPMGVK